MTPYTTFYDDVMPELPGCETALVLHHIKRTCNDFYERSLYSREVLAGINVVAGTGTYTAVPSDATNFDVCKILGVKLLDAAGQANPGKLFARTPDQLDEELPHWETRQGSVKYYAQRALDKVTLAYIPSTAVTSGLVITIAKLPKYGGGGIDDDVWQKFSESLAAGVKHRLMKMDKKPWSSPSKAVMYGEIFESEVAAAGAIAAKGYGRGPLRTKAWG